MPIELVCGQCQEHLLAEQPGSIVACPHCGTHLHVPGETSDQPASDQTELNPTLIATDGLLSAAPAAEEESLAPAVPDTELFSANDGLRFPEPAVAPQPVNTESAAPNAPAETAPSAPMTAMSSVAAASTAAAAAMPTIVDHGPTPVPMVPRFWFMLAASYASAVTLAFLFLLLTLGRIKTHPLENLPDVVPKIQNGEVALQVAPPDANVAPQHVLALGETRRFGSVNVTPLKVTQGTLQFEHVLKDPTAQRASSQPVLKLWVRFENVSRNQTFSPLDATLLFKRHYADFGNTVLTNQFLCRTEERKRGDGLHHPYELSATSEFRIAGQNLDSVLSPGQSVELFIPSEERIDDLTGDLVWRVQFRKGYHHRTLHGVTTLIDVPFRRQDVSTEG